EGETPRREATNGSRGQMDRLRREAGSAPSVAVVCGRVPGGVRRDALVGHQDRDAPVRSICGAVPIHRPPQQVNWVVREGGDCVEREPRKDVVFLKTGREIKQALQVRIADLQGRLAKRNAALDVILSDKARVRAYLVRQPNMQFASQRNFGE